MLFLFLSPRPQRTCSTGFLIWNGIGDCDWFVSLERSIISPIKPYTPMFPSDKKSGYIQAVGYIYVGFGFLLFYCRDTTDWKFVFSWAWQKVGGCRTVDNDNEKQKEREMTNCSFLFWIVKKERWPLDVEPLFSTQNLLCFPRRVNVFQF